MKVEYFHIPETCTADTYNMWGVAYGFTFGLLIRTRLRSSYYVGFRQDFYESDEGEWSLDAPEFMPAGSCFSVNYCLNKPHAIMEWARRERGWQ